MTTTDELMVALTEVRTAFPDWRLGQLIANLTMAAGRDGAIWDVEDDELLVAARRLIQRNMARAAGDPVGASPRP
jgi:hypothetical protein